MRVCVVTEIKCGFHELQKLIIETKSHMVNLMANQYALHAPQYFILIVGYAIKYLNPLLLIIFFSSPTECLYLLDACFEKFIENDLKMVYTHQNTHTD